MDQIKSKRILKLIYRGNNIFSILLSSGNQSLSINLIECFGLHDNGVVNGLIENYDIGPLGSKYTFIREKLNLQSDLYKQIWIKTKKEENIVEAELMAACKEIIVSDNIHLYNPISEDKY